MESLLIMLLVMLIAIMVLLIGGIVICLLYDNNKFNTEGIYIASLVLGIYSLLSCAIPMVGLILSIVSLIICIKGRKKLKLNNETKGMVTVGFVSSIIGLILSMFILVFSGVKISSLIAEEKKEDTALIVETEEKEYSEEDEKLTAEEKMIIEMAERSKKLTGIADAKEDAWELVENYKADCYVERTYSKDYDIDIREYVRQKIGNGQVNKNHFIKIDDSYKITVYEGTNSSAVKSENKIITGTLGEKAELIWDE